MSPFATLNPKTILSHARPGEVLAITVLAALVAHTMMNWLGRIAAPTTWDYGPAQLAVHVAMFARGAPLYRDFRSAPFIPLVYGPVVPILTAKLAPIFGRGTMAALEAGRVLRLFQRIRGTAAADTFEAGAGIAGRAHTAGGPYRSPSRCRYR